MNSSKNLRHKLEKNEPCLGLFHLTASCIVSEAMSVSNIDWLVYDMEASPASKIGLVQFLQSMKSSSVTPLVRTQSKEHEHIEQVLDAGACGIIIPKVDDKATCEKVVRAVKFPPLGCRGLNPVRASSYFTNVKEYIEKANNHILVFVQIESRQAVKNIDDILSVDGVDGVFVGCGDLSMDLDCPGEMYNESLLGAIKNVLNACKTRKKFPGIFAYDMDLAEKFIRDGYKFVAFGNDITVLKRAIEKDCISLKLLKGVK